MFSFWNLTSRLASFIKHFLCESAERENLWRNRDNGQYSKSFSLLLFVFFSIITLILIQNCPSSICMSLSSQMTWRGPLSLHSLILCVSPLSLFLFPRLFEELTLECWTAHLGPHHNRSTWTSCVPPPLLKPGSRVHTQQCYAIDAVNTQFQWQVELAGASGTGTCKICSYKKHALFLLFSGFMNALSGTCSFCSLFHFISVY